MNREIKFRGRDESGKWHYGSLLYKEEESPVQETNAPYIETYIEGAGLNDPKIEVTPYTVGQFTGLKDANGKEIYEWDIVTIGSNLKAMVIWFNGSFRFKDELSSKATYLDDIGTIMRDYDVTIIGNIHDNPELLKGGE
ncbi:MAG: YopX family protein [Alloprevotella sp.]